ncbi:DUF2101 domain-containing protein [Thermococcus sp. MV5]|uniref:DUF2101 family protein n=1 Tax=Thermococcus sp. MV5 TaxID=1638272 RepID=UPI00143C23A0|nr:DUF2101 family protein [Thermococcus sp. MV5]NJE25923.1 DUF2101 domain-containing protein [Thermococcus sp. MV5]
MSFGEILYKVGEIGESFAKKSVKWFSEIAKPTPSKTPPKFKILRKLIKRELTVHELLSLSIQLSFIIYLILSLLLVLFANELYLTLLFVFYFIYLRYTILKNREFFIEVEPYRFFYYGLTIIGFLSFLGYLLVRRVAKNVYYFYAYLIAIFAVVLLFRHLYKSKFTRDWTYGVVEEIKGELVKVSVHDDIRANVKPGKYWVDNTEDVEVGDVVKILVEERIFRSSLPKRVLEVHKAKPSSSETSTEPKAESEKSNSR